MIRIALLLLVLLPAPAADRVVYAWFPRDFNNWDTKAIRWDAITHLCYRSVVLQPDGTLKEAAPAEKARALVAEARKHGVKVTVLAWGTTAENSSKYLANCPEKSVQSLLAYVKKYDLDGVNIDDETWRKDNTETKGPNRDLVTNFFRLLRKAFKAEGREYHLTYASPGVISPEDRFGDAWLDIAAIADEIDGFTVMSYVMSPPSIGWTGGAQPLGGGPRIGKHARDLETLVADYVAATGGKKDKIIFGLANDRGGSEWDCRTGQPLSPIVGPPRRLTPEAARKNTETHGRKFDPKQKTPWYAYEKDGRWVQGWYEDEESLAAKAAFIRESGLKGICVWVVDGVAEPPGTFTILEKFLK